ncbi:hypothetical protein J4H86_17055 [Spiractinospora alimapuensis]|nr:hypothetical protein [Spiractinospora alimapuensis]QVQ50600.1 hypothetical protein J4H86_17055 [Spiractinospora alimapuensis]
MLPYAAYLRVYQPISAYPPRTRAYWRAYAHSPHRPRRHGAVAAEHAENLRRAVSSPARVAPHSESEHAYVRRWNGQTYVCPWQTRLRSWMAFRDFWRSTPRGLLSSYLPDTAAGAARAGYESWARDGEPSAAQILTSTWRIPLTWFALFEDAERCLVLGGKHAPPSSPHDQLSPERPEPPPRSLLYVTGMSEARRRAATVHQLLPPTRDPRPGDAALARREGILPALRRMPSLEEWLHTWHPNSLIELDYGGLVQLLSDDHLRADHSAAEVAAAIDGDRLGQRPVALAMYRRLKRRWRAVRALERAN